MEQKPPRFPLGYHLTFRSYGTWLPGDDRGWTHHGDHGESKRPPSPPLAGWCARRLRASVLTFGPRCVALVESAIQETCRRRGWTLHTLAVVSDHLHVVVTADAAPESLVRLFKQWSTRYLRDAEVLAPDRPVWAAHGSTRWLYTERRFQNSLAYVRRHRRMRKAVIDRE
jgi:REP element-mobilizing transposase RayT